MNSFRNLKRLNELFQDTKKLHKTIPRDVVFIGKTPIQQVFTAGNTLHQRCYLLLRRLWVARFARDPRLNVPVLISVEISKQRGAISQEAMNVPKRLVNSWLASLELRGDFERKSSGEWLSVLARHPVQTESKGFVGWRVARGLISLSSVRLCTTPFRGTRTCTTVLRARNQPPPSPVSLRFCCTDSLVFLRLRRGTSIYDSVQVASMNLDVPL